MKTLVTGANGNIGKEFVNQLAEKTAVKAAVRNLEKSIQNPKAEYVTFDYNRTETYETALEGVSKVLLTAPPLDSESYERLTPFIDFIQEKGIERVALLTALGVNQNPEAPLRKIELKLINDGFDYTIIRPNFFMENFSLGFAAADIKNNNIIVNSAGKGKTSFISIKDIAAVFTSVLTEEGHIGKEYDLTGKEALSYDEVVKVISGVSRKQINNVSLSHDDLKAGAIEAGMPELAVDYLIMLYDFVAKGCLEFTNNTVEEILGRKPIGFSEFASANVEYWKAEGARQEG